MKNFVVVLVLFITGCSTTGRMNKVSLGMTKQQVIQTIGNPASTRAAQGSEYLVYHLSDRSVFTRIVMAKYGEPASAGEDDYYVRLRNGYVDAYGKVGDFDSTHPVEQKIDMNVKVNSSTGQEQQ